MEQSEIHNVYIEEAKTLNMIVWRCERMDCNDKLIPTMPNGNGLNGLNPMFCRTCRQITTSAVPSYALDVVICDKHNNTLTEYKLYHQAAEKLIGCEIKELLKASVIMIEIVPDLLEMLKIILRGTLCDLFPYYQQNTRVVRQIYLHGRDGLQMLSLKK
ncbi:hypothetical protein CLU79DRAFT_837300 [Phycomyces nitens]|nr:hypothetical protein CLU79DRAFT_837300 [Phycomyces nitens]